MANTAALKIRAAVNVLVEALAAPLMFDLTGTGAELETRIG